MRIIAALVLALSLSGVCVAAPAVQEAASAKPPVTIAFTGIGLPSKGADWRFAVEERWVSDYNRFLSENTKANIIPGVEMVNATQKIKAASLLETANIQALGRQLGADMVLVYIGELWWPRGDYWDINDSIRLVDVATGQVTEIKVPCKVPRKNTEKVWYTLWTQAGFNALKPHLPAIASLGGQP